ncbi:MAG: PAS domain S-box protein [Fimbriimonadaceae bacterium]|nr:PAS domain S-box protein [Fimbriimonadaceae bacterium]
MVWRFRKPNMGLSTRLIIASVFLVAFTALSVGYLSYRNLESVIIPTEMERLETLTRRRTAQFTSFTEDTQAEIISVRGSEAVEGIIRATVGGGIDSVAGETLEEWKRVLANNLAASLKARPSYYQFRLIGVANGGKELVRVDRGGQEGSIRIVQSDGLQEKGSRSYFARTLELQNGETYVSPVELNREQGKVEVPHVPIMRVCTPVHLPSGKVFAILVISIDMRIVLERIRSMAAVGATLYAVDSQGNYLIHPQKDREFASDLGKDSTWQEDFPSFTSAFASGEDIAYATMGSGPDQLYVVASTVQLMDKKFVAIIQTMPRSIVMAPADAVRKAGMFGGFAAVVIAVLFAVLIARSQIKPLEQLTAAVEHFDGEETLEVPTSAAGEIGVLAQSFDSMMADIRDKTTSLRNMYEMEKLYGAVVESSSEAIITVSLDGVITAWNAAAESVFGYSAQEMIGQPVELLVPEDRKNEIKEELELMVRGERRERFETVRLNKSGQPLFVSATISPVFGEDGEVVCFSKMVRDISDQKKLEERLRLAQKMEAMGTLAGGIAHDFNNVLTAIVGNVKLAQDELEFDHPVQRDLSEIEKASARGASVVRQILRMSRSEAPKNEQVNVEAVIQETIQFLKATKPNNIEIDIQFDPDMPAILGDSTELHQVMMNLGVNAFHALRDRGGKLEIRGTVITLDEVAAGTFPNLTPGRFVRISVSDTGKGMDSQTLQRIFEPFFTTKGNGEGTGLGLSVVYGIVERHGGAITAYSEPDRGTMFRIYLPAMESSAPASSANDDRVFRGNGESIMYVDDDEALVLMVTRMLRRLNYEVAGFTDPQEALKVFLSDTQRFEIVVTDMSMPHIDGPEFVRQLLAVRPDVPVIMVTGYIRPEDIEQTNDLGIRKLVLKPNTVQDMGQILHELLEELRIKKGSS